MTATPEPAPLTGSRLRTLIMRYLAENPRATTPQIREALGVAENDLAGSRAVLDELDGMADDRLLSLHNVGGLIGWEIIR